jgi:hypothetical protein
VRLVDAVFRQGHLSEQALVEALMTGERPAHLDRCDLCAERAVEMGRWLDEVRVIGQEAADEVFTPERLSAQHAQILRKLEQLDEPSRVIAFPRNTRSEARESGMRKVAPAWVGVAAAAGLALGIVGGQVSARMSIQPVIQVQPPAVADARQPSDVTPISATESVGPPARDLKLIEMDLEGIPGELEFLNNATPRLISTSTRR